MISDALYYLWIEPPNETTLVNSIFYWDHLHTIVPASMNRPFHNQCTKAAEELGFLRRRLVDPQCAEVRIASREFAEDLGRLAILHDVQDVREQGARWGTGGYRIHVDKVSSAIHPSRLQQGIRGRIWKTTVPDRHGFLRMHEGYAASYMARLASVVAERDDLAPLTDRRASHDVIIDRFCEADERDVVGANEARLANLSIEAIKIHSGVKLSDALSFRDSNYAQLKRYRKAIRSLALQISAVKSPEAREREFKRIAREKFSSARDELGKKLGEAGFDFGTNILQITVAAGVGWMTGGPLGAIGAFGVGLGFSLVRWRTSRSRVQNEPMTYLASLQQNFPANGDG